MARLHSGDPSIYSAVAEQCRRLEALGIDYEIVPGVPAFAAAAAALGRELTVPGVAQTVTLTRVATLSTAMPAGEELGAHGHRRRHPGDPSGGASHRRRSSPELLTAGLAADTPVAVVAFASWPEQIVLRGTLADIADQMHARLGHPHRGDHRRRCAGRRRLPDSYLYSSGRERGTRH